MLTKNNLSNVSSRLRGFTLIELLLVISIISLFSSISLSALGPARAAARDARRLADMQQITKALQLFYADNGRFPDFQDGLSVLGECVGAECGGTGNPPTSLNTLSVALAPYIKNLPRDPLHNCPDSADASTVEATTICDSSFFYAYDFSHGVGTWNGSFCVNDPTVVGDSLSGVVVLSINRLENTKNRHQDTCIGDDMNIASSDYNIIVCRNTTGSACFQKVN